MELSQFVQRLVLTSQISLLEAGLERKKGMIKEKEEGYTCMCEYGGACTNCLVKNYNMAIQEDIDYLQDQITKCKELIK